MLDKEKVELTMKIVNRAETLGLMQTDRITALLDLEKATEHFNLRLEDMLNADNFNFAHDFVQIQSDIDRATGKFSNRFVPRFAGRKS